MRPDQAIWIALGGVLLLAGGGAAVLAGSAPSQHQPENARPLWSTLPGEQTDDTVTPHAASFARLVERARPAVVALHTRVRSGVQSGVTQERFPFDPWRLFPEVPRREREEGIGSGFVIRADGYLVTNHHVVEHADSVEVRVAGLGAALPARVVGTDARSDLALLKVDPPRPLPVLPLGSSSALPVGAWVVAIGHPFGLTHVATKGIVSGKGRTLGDIPRFRPDYYDFIQTDAAIDRGNSGGPLLNLRGEVVGINTAINSRARGIGFAVPVDLAKAVLPRLRAQGRVVRSYLGVSIDPVTWEIATSFGRRDSDGVVVTRVVEDTPAERAGLHKGDIILEFNQSPVAGPGDMSWKASTAPSGRPVPVVIWRDGARRRLEITPVVRKGQQEKPDNRAARAEAAPSPGLGLVIMDLDEKTAAVGGLPEGTRGVVVVGAEADAATHGIRVGDVITSVNGKEVADEAAFEQAVDEVPRGEMIRFYVLRQRSALFVALPKRWD